MELIMQKKRTKGQNLKSDKVSLRTRLFSMRKGSKFLFVSSSNSELKATEIVRYVKDLATKEHCETIIHAGWSFKNARQKSTSLIIRAIRDAIKDSRIRRYIAEIRRNYYIGHLERGCPTVTRCTRQRFYNSSGEQRSCIEGFLHEINTLRPTKVASNTEYPSFLLICGENNVFNTHNRGGSSTIRTGFPADQFLATFHRIQHKPWLILNPSHRPYTRPAIYNSVRKYHKAASRDSKRVSMVVTGNNRSHRKPKIDLNRALIWKKGKPRQLDLLKEGQEDSIYIYLGRIRA